MSGGIEDVLHSANRVLSEYHNDGSLATLTMDFLNAFRQISITPRGKGKVSIYFFVGGFLIWAGNEVVYRRHTYLVYH